MMYLAKTKKGVFLVEAIHFKAAIGFMRHAGACEEDDVPVMISAFANEIRGVHKAMVNFVGCPVETLSAAIVEYREACVALSWIGHTDVESHAEIEREHDEARAEIERILGQPLPKVDGDEQVSVLCSPSD